MSNYETQILLHLYKSKFDKLNQALKSLIKNSINNKYNTGHDFLQDPRNVQITNIFGWSNDHCPNLMKIYLTLKIAKNETKLNYNNFLSRKNNSNN